MVTSASTCPFPKHRRITKSGAYLDGIAAADMETGAVVANRSIKLDTVPMTISSLLAGDGAASTMLLSSSGFEHNVHGTVRDARVFGLWFDETWA